MRKLVTYPILYFVFQNTKMDIIKLIERYNTHEACISYLEKQRWNDEPVCPYCQSKKSTPVQTECRHKCNSCKKSFSVLVGTVFMSTKLPLTKWFLAIYLILDAKKGISSLQLSRHLNVNKDTAWFMQKRLRTAMKENNLLHGIVEIDETYIGGSMTKMTKLKKRKKGLFPCGMEHKTPILGMLQRNGKVILKAINKANGIIMQPILKQNISPKSTIVTDGFGGYYNLKSHFQEHIILNHNKNIFNIDEFNTSGIEGFWTIIKRAIIGVYHKISDKYLQNYIDEIAFKFNNRMNNQVFNSLINNMLNYISL